MSSDDLPPEDSADESKLPLVDSGSPSGRSDTAEEETDTTDDTETVTVPRDEGLYQRSLNNAVIAARCADEMRAQDVVV
ncbi:MAG: hypothetical protein GY826_28010, partial [Fuerstiella sp.]|nr:hypothetical protein [Fuerstiella sp.]